MPAVVALALTSEGDVFVAEDQDTLNWVLALRLVAQTPSSRLPLGAAGALGDALVAEQWGDAVEQWMSLTGSVVDVYPSAELYMAGDVTLAAAELQFTPLFRDD
jgi:hypothetical protein